MAAVDFYDRVDLYDRLFDWDPAAERDFVLGASERWGLGRARRILEPFCGPGRLLRAMPGEAVGFDLNRRMLRRAARDCRVFRADAARFSVRAGSFELGYCLIDSFRHLLTEEAARAHLRCMGVALRPGAVYVLGFELTGDMTVAASAEEWTVEHEGIEIRGRFSGLGDQDPETRLETSRVEIEAGAERIDETFPMRAYAREQFQDLVDGEGSFEIAACFDRSYDLDRAVELDELEGSAVIVLRRV
jgi:SAM-dependent methyltransferase